MRLLLTVFIIGIIVNHSTAQIINANPDPNGEPWIVGKIPEYTQEFIEKLNGIPELELTQASFQLILPTEVDNSQKKYMRPIFPQEDQSCAQAAGVAYNLTYEISMLRDIDVSNPNDTTNWYPTHFTYNFLNNGSNSGSSIIEGWDIIKEQGCPTVLTWGGMAGDYTRWMTGYENYDTSFYNRLTSYSKITITDSTKLDILKHWISDHNEGDSIGGLSNFTANMSGIGYTYFPEESPEAGKWLIAYFGDTALHALTIVGYNDSVRYDFNEDNTFTKNIDINDDDTVDLRDWEFGAVKVANSWGTGYADEGFVYVPYRLLAENSAAGGITLNQVYVIQLDTTEQNQRYDIDPEDRPAMVLRFKLEHPQRSALKFRVGYGQTASDTIPYEKKLNYSFSQHGGPLPMQGINEDPIEFEFDFPYYFNQFFGQSPEHFGKVFLEIEEYVNLYDSATFLEFSLKDYRWNEEFELSYDDLPHYFLPGSGKDTLLMGIEYDLLPFEMVASPFNHYNFTSNKICRLVCTASDSAEVTFGNGIDVDFYHGTLIIEEDASLTIGDDVTIHSHSDADSIIVYGQLEIGKNVSFIADKDTALVIEIRNPNFALQVDQAYFQNVDFSGYNNTLIIEGSQFKKSNLRFFRTTDECFILTNSRFDTTEVKATVDEVSAKDFGTVTVTDCNFHTNRIKPVINIEAYKNFELSRDSLIYTSGDGIRLYHSGSSTGQSHLIKDCYLQCEMILHMTQ